MVNKGDTTISVVGECSDKICVAIDSDNVNG